MLWVAMIRFQWPVFSFYTSDVGFHRRVHLLSLFLLCVWVFSRCFLFWLVNTLNHRVIQPAQPWTIKFVIQFNRRAFPRRWITLRSFRKVISNRRNWSRWELFRSCSCSSPNLWLAADDSSNNTWRCCHSWASIRYSTWPIQSSFNHQIPPVTSRWHLKKQTNHKPSLLILCLRLLIPNRSSIWLACQSLLSSNW